MLAGKKPAANAPEVNLRNPLHIGKKYIGKGSTLALKTQGRHHQKSKTGLSVAPEKGLKSSKIFFEKKKSHYLRAIILGTMVPDGGTLGPGKRLRGLHM